MPITSEASDYSRLRGAQRSVLCADLAADNIKNTILACSENLLDNANVAQR
jgi:hypothetical protein